MSNPNIGLLSAKGNAARYSRLTPEERKNIASNAAKARWEARREALEKQREAQEIASSHTCTDLCKCWKCNRDKYKHTKYSEVKCDFLCETIAKGNQDWQ